MKVEEYDVEHSEQPGTTTYALFNQKDKIVFFPATDKTLNEGASPRIDDPVLHHNAEENAGLGGYFLRKGFSSAIKDADESVITPIYIDPQGKEISEPLTKEQAIDGIFNKKLSISGFRYNENATPEQRNAAFENVLRHFVSTSNDPDFSLSAAKHIFRIGIAPNEIGKKGNHIEYNTENPDAHIGDGEIMYRLGMKTADAARYCLSKVKRKMQKTNKPDTERETTSPAEPGKTKTPVDAALRRVRDKIPPKPSKLDPATVSLWKRRNDDPRFPH